ncbi:MAG: DUF1330 domain-containing protein [Ruegeria sp.]
MTGYIDPDRSQFEAFKVLDRDHPIEMLNLVRFRQKAEYPSGHELSDSGLSGAEAYHRYGVETAPIIARLGAAIIWRGTFETTLIGASDTVWDEMFVARYPSSHAFLEMVTDPTYRAAVVHRQAAVTDSRLIRCAPAETGVAFG